MASDLVVSTGFAVITPGPDLSARFLGWLAQSSPFIDEIVARSVGVSYPAVNASEIGEIRVDLPTIGRQREIADFLDAETARLDALIERKRRLAAMIHERRAGVLEDGIRGLIRSQGGVPLKYLVDAVIVGIVVTPAAWYVPSGEGVPALRGMNVSPGQISSDDLIEISHAGHQLHAKSALHVGDVVVVRTGQAGAAAVVPPRFAGANCIDLIVIRPGLRVIPEFLELVINSDWTQKFVAANAVGTIQSHFNVGAIRQLPVPAASIDVQETTVERLVHAMKPLDDAAALLGEQASRLRERRQAFITAAVTGELDRASAKSRFSRSG